MASIRKRNGKYQALVRRSGIGQVGKSFLTKKEAERWARQTEIQIESGQYQSIRDEAAIPTASEAIDRYVAEVTSQKRGADPERIRLRAIQRHEWTKINIAHITARHLAEFRDTRLKTVCGSTVRREMLLIRHIFEVARKEWRLPIMGNPIDDVSRPASNPSRDRRLDESEFQKLFQSLSRCRHLDVIPAVRLAIATGMRRGELLSLNWDDIDWRSETASLNRTKNGYKRVVPLSSDAISLLRRLEGRVKNGGRVFRISANALRLAWERAVLRAQIKDYHFHDLRHEAISRFFELGLSVPEVALISGHKTPTMLFRYTHLRPEDVGNKLRKSIAAKDDASKNGAA
jgi:integrase